MAIRFRTGSRNGGWDGCAPPSGEGRSAQTREGQPWIHRTVGSRHLRTAPRVAPPAARLSPHGRPEHPPFDQGLLVHRVGDPRDDAPRGPPRRDQPRAGVPGLPGARRRSRRRRAARSPRTTTSTRSRGACRRSGRRSRPVRRALRHATSTRDRDLRHVRLDRGDVARVPRACSIAGDEVVVFEPFYENYCPDAILAGAAPRYVTLRPPDWTFDEASCARRSGPRRAPIIVNSPHNPTGKVFTREELSMIAELCIELRRDRDHRRDLRAHHLRRPRPRADRDAPRHARADGHDQRALEDVLGHGVAGRLGGRAAARSWRGSARCTTS